MDDEEFLDGLLDEDEQQAAAKSRKKLDVQLPATWEPKQEEIERRAKRVAVLDSQPAADIPVFDVSLYVLTIVCMHAEDMLQSTPP